LSPPVPRRKKGPRSPRPRSRWSRARCGSRPRRAAQGAQGARELAAGPARRAGRGPPDLATAKIGISVVDAATGDKLYAKNGGQKLKLASNAKILTAAAALSILGPEYRYRTTVFADKLLPDGTVQGNLYLRGSGDPSLDTRRCGRWSTSSGSSA
jgi:hypothetical protein